MFTSFFYNLCEHSKRVRTVFYISSYGFTFEGIVAIAAEVVAIAGDEGKEGCGNTAAY